MVGNIGCSFPNRECSVFFEYLIVKAKHYDLINTNGDLLTHPNVTENIIVEEQIIYVVSMSLYITNILV